MPPTTRREFQRTDRATALVRVYQRGAKTALPASMAVQITDTTGARVHSSAAVIDAGEFERERAANCQITLPLSSLTPGAYLLTFEATAGQHMTRRDVRFTVR